MDKPTHTFGNIKVHEPIDARGQINDIDGVAWDVISVWSGGDYVTAAKTADLTNEYSRWGPYEVMIVSAD